MKTFVPFKTKNFILLFGSLVAVLFSTSAFSQNQNSQSVTIPELVFQGNQWDNTSSPAGQNGAKYRFNNVGPGVDAVLEIRNRSSNSVVVNNIDISSTGWGKALQPEVGFPNGVGANQNWWVRFRLTFYKSGTNDKQKITQFAVTSLDIDGHNGTLREWVQMDKIKTVSFSQVTNLTDNLLGTVLDLLDFNNNGEDHRITGSNQDYAGIDTAATNLMATYTYENKDQIDFYLGGRTGNSGSSNAMRMNSLWFKSFNLNIPGTLPVKLTDFSAKYNKTSVTLNWKTSEERVFSHYELQHSSDGVNYSQTAIVFGAALEGQGASYSYIDRSVNGRSGLIYYRLKMIDKDGHFSYSPVRIVRLGEEKQAMTVSTYPNPVMNDLRVTVPSAWQGKQVMIELYNANGHKVKSFATSNSSQTENISVVNIDKGVYFLKAVCGTEIANQTIIKK